MRFKSLMLAITSAVFISMTATVTQSVKERLGKQYGYSSNDVFDKYDSIPFYAAGLLVSPLIGILCGMISRKILVAFTGILAALSVFLLTFQSMNHVGLRFLSGIAYGAQLPILMSLIGDWYDEEERLTYSSVGAFANAIGLAGGYFLSYLGKSSDEAMQAMLYILTLLITVTSVLYSIFGEDPTEVRRYTKRSDWKTLGSWTNLAVYQLSFPGQIPMALFMLKLDPDGVPLACLILGSALSLCIATVISNRLTVSAQGRFSGFFAGFRAVIAFFILNNKLDRNWICMFLWGLVNFMHVPVSGAIVLTANIPEVRGTAVAIGAGCEDLSRMMAPLILEIGKFVLKPSLTKDDAFNRDVIPYFSILWIITGILYYVGYQHFTTDTQTVKDILEGDARREKVTLEKGKSLERVKLIVKP
jgi:MFS family permease